MQGSEHESDRSPSHEPRPIPAIEFLLPPKLGEHTSPPPRRRIHQELTEGLSLAAMVTDAPPTPQSTAETSPAPRIERGRQRVTWRFRAWDGGAFYAGEAQDIAQVRVHLDGAAEPLAWVAALALRDEDRSIIQSLPAPMPPVELHTHVGELMVPSRHVHAQRLCVVGTDARGRPTYLLDRAADTETEVAIEQALAHIGALDPAVAEELRSSRRSEERAVVIPLRRALGAP